MKKLFLSSFVIPVMIFTASGILLAQDIRGGTVRYQQTTKLDFSGMMGGSGGGGNFTMRGGGSVRMNDMIASLPKERKENKVLYFEEDRSLYAGDETEGEEQSMEMGGRHLRFTFMGASRSELQAVYYDFGKNEKTEQLGFMTRDFLVSGEINNNAWKLTNKVTKILNYTCMAAQMQKDDKTIIAWFTSEIPFSAGPADYFGLPGLILAIEIDGETALLATSIDLTLPAEGLLVKPTDGKKVTQEEFDKIMAEKMKEIEETRDKDGNRRIRIIHEN